MDLGVWSRPLGFMTSIWLFGSSFIYFFPNYYPIHYTTHVDDYGYGVPTEVGSDMNWLFVVVIGFFIIFALNWYFSARHHFKGPKRFADAKESLRIQMIEHNQNSLYC